MESVHTFCKACAALALVDEPAESTLHFCLGPKHHSHRICAIAKSMHQHRSDAQNKKAFVSPFRRLDEGFIALPTE